MNSTAQLRVLIRLALRSITSHRVKSLIVGGILTFGTFLLVLVTTFLNNITGQMEKSVTGSLIGNAQVLSAKAKDDLTFFGNGPNGQQDIGLIDDFPKVRDALARLPNVKAVIPMGRDAAAAAGGNILDQKLGELREAVKTHDAHKTGVLQARIRQLAEILRVEFENRRELSSNVEEIEKNLAIATRALSPDFWAEFDRDPLPALEWLDTRLAPLQEDGAQLFLNYIGTDLDLFAQQFDTFEIVAGQMVPPGQRGMLISREFYERQAKNMIARELDLIRDGIHKDQKTIADDTVLKEKAAKIVRQSKRLVYQMGPDESAGCESDLRGFLGAEAKGDLAELVRTLVTVDDANFDARYAAFYKFVAPRIQLYSVRIGDMLTLRAFSKSGYAHAVNIKVYGTFHFRGLDDSLLASAYSLVDIMTFRQLYGLMTPEKKQELDAIKANVGVKDVSADDAEAALFGGSGGGDGLEQNTQATTIAEDNSRPLERPRADDQKPFTKADIDNGVVLHASVLLKDGNQLRQTMLDIQKVSDDEKLGIKVIDWRAAAGVIGQFIFALAVGLVATFVIIFITALAIINNSMMMSMMDRIMEIGTMRAIGAQRNFVLAMFLLESAVLSIGAMVLGIGAAWGLTAFLASKGWPAATNDISVVLYGGPHLYPHMTTTAVVVGTVCIALVSFIATLYPALIATRVQPVVAMQRRE